VIANRLASQGVQALIGRHVLQRCLLIHDGLFTLAFWSKSIQAQSWFDRVLAHSPWRSADRLWPWCRFGTCSVTIRRVFFQLAGMQGEENS
jgi:hypothetical protein